MRNVLEWSDFSLPEQTRKDARAMLFGGSLLCVFSSIWTAFMYYRILAAPIENFFQYGALGLIGAILFRQGEKARWVAQQRLSHLTAYRREQGYMDPAQSSFPTHSLPGQPSRTGIRIIIFGGLIYGIGGLITILSILYLRDVVVGGEGPQWRVYIHLATLLLGIGNIAVGNAVLRLAVQHFDKIISSPADLTPGSYTLYLRSFKDDPRLARPHRFPGLGALVRGWFTLGHSEEQRLDAALAWAGPKVGVGGPGERVPRAGASRMYLPYHDWQAPVREMIRGASLVVIVLGQGAGTLWELGEAMRVLPPQRLLLIVPMRLKKYNEFRKIAEMELQAQAERVQRTTGAHWIPPALPDYIGSRVISSTIQGLIYFTQDWEAIFVRLERPPILEDQLIGALDRGMWPSMAQLTDYEQQIGARHG